ncbi:MAG: hypothetical protein SNJ64_01800 [Endomicrobiia bacterium]
MIKSLYFTCIPKHIYLKISFEDIGNIFFNHIKKKYKYFIVKKVFNNNSDVIDVNVVSNKKIKKDNGIFYVRKDFGVNINLFQKKVDCFVCENIYSFDSMLRIIFGAVLFNKNGLLLHSSGVVYRNKGFLFVGESGKGKSTLIKNSFSEKIKILSDELVPVIYIKKNFFTYKSPFWGEIQPENKIKQVVVKDKMFEIKSIFILNRHTKNCVIKKITLDDSIKKILRNNLCLFKYSLLVDKILSTVFKVVSKIKIFRLDFNKQFVINKNFLENEI